MEKTLHEIRLLLTENKLKQAKELYIELTTNSSTQKPSSSIVLQFILRDFYARQVLNCGICLNFLASLPLREDTLNGLEILNQVDQILKQMTRDGNVYINWEMAFFIYEYMKKYEQETTSNLMEGRIRVESFFYEWFPPSVRAIVQSKEMILESKAYPNEMFYAPFDDFCFDEHRRNVFCWIPPWTQDGQKEKWRFIPGDLTNSTRPWFYIQSIEYGEYLYAADYAKFGKDGLGNKRSRVFTWKKGLPGESGQWQLILQDDPNEEGDVFAIYNTYQKEFLYAATETIDSHRRYVLTSAFRPKEPQWLKERKWKLLPSQVDALEIGIEAFFQKDFPAAIEFFTKAIEEFPDHTQHVKCFAYRMVSHLRMGNVEGDHIKKDFQAIEELGGEKAAFFHGVTHLYEEVVQALEAMVEEEDGLTSTTSSNATTMTTFTKRRGHFIKRQLVLGENLFAKRQYTQALGCYEKAKEKILQISSSSQALKWLFVCRKIDFLCAKAHAALGHKEIALDLLEKNLIAISPSRSTATISMDFLSIDTQVDEEEDALLIPFEWQNQNKTQVDILEAQMWLLQGQLYRKLERFEPSGQSFEKAFDIAPSHCFLKQSASMELHFLKAVEARNRSSTISPIVAPSSPTTKIENQMEKIMESFYCPLSMDLMTDPVLTPSGMTYEREMIEQHLEVNGHFDPFTRVTLTKEMLYPNRTLKTLMQTLLKADRLGILSACMDEK